MVTMMDHKASHDKTLNIKSKVHYKEAKVSWSDSLVGSVILCNTAVREFVTFYLLENTCQALQSILLSMAS